MPAKERPWLLYFSVSTAIVIVVPGLFFESMRSMVSATAQQLDAIRTVGLFLVAFLGAGVALWRGIIADRERDNAERRWALQRFKEGAEMVVDDENPKRRLAGVRFLDMLVAENPYDIGKEVTDFLLDLDADD